MSELEEKLDGCKETLQTDCELDLNPEQKAFLERQAICNDKMLRREDSVERVNKKSGIIDVLFQGDMLLSKEQQHDLIADIGDSRSKRQAYNDTSYPGRRWSKGVFYSLDGTLNETAKAAFRKAAELWMNDTCIDFIEDLEEEAEDLLLVFSEYGCWAEVGRQEGWQLLSLGEGCGTPDRRKQFVRRSRKVNNNYNITYDYGSVMHYGAKSFINASLVKGNFTILPKDVNYTETLGSKFIGFYDLLMMNMYYNCTDICKSEHNADEKCNGGFPHPRDCSKCICPSGYGGQHCDERPPGCGEELNATDTWQWLNDSLHGGEVGRDGLKKCHYWIKAPNGSKIEIKLVEVPEHHYEGCTHAGVEIKTQADQRLTGYSYRLLIEHMANISEIIYDVE
ncbi:astacin [Teladorsagia circumcincta]|uniref:Zinc metalloproteinase n=1 Tax=Teladorsagia circumcincta TaxID=45464 RepID=A0A2G9U764_TELCI|nr:astacin [Teladorsagia circumcincta]